MGRPSDDQSISVKQAQAMIDRPEVCKEELEYVIGHVTGVGAEKVREEAKARLGTVPTYGEQLRQKAA